MKKIMISLFLLLATSCYAFAANDTIEELIAALEGKEPEVIAQETKQKQDVEWAKKEIEAVKKNLRFQVDKIENITWTHTRQNQIATHLFDIYCGEWNGGPWKGSLFLKLVIKPEMEAEPMVMETVIINVDGNVHSFAVPPRFRKTTSEVMSYKGINGVKVQRWYMERVEMPIYGEVENILQQAVEGKETLIRLRGRYSFDFKMTKTQRNAFDSLLRYYKARQIILSSQK